MKKNLLWMGMLLLVLAGCSNDDDSTNTDEQNLLGYWEAAESDTSEIESVEWQPSGLVFEKGGEVKYWGTSFCGTGLDFPIIESHWGLWWFDDSGRLQIKAGSKEPNPDELYYTVMSLTKDRMVIRVYGGFAGTPFEKGTDVVYKKVSGSYYI